MRRTRPKRVAYRRSSERKSISNRANDRFEATLTAILTDIAKVLIPSGFGISGLSKLARRAYLDAARAIQCDLGQSQNNAQIAALTGLTRAEVSKLSRRVSLTGDYQTAPLNRPQRVSLGWTSDLDYCDKAGMPRVLPFSRHRKSFETLVRRYSGDIPARAMLSEMTRLGMTRELPNRAIRLVRPDMQIQQRSASALGAIRPWTGFLAESQDEEDKDLRANTARIQLNFDSLPQLFSAVRELQDRAQAFVANIRGLSGRRNSRRPHRLQISIALATRVPRQVSPVLRKRVKRAS